MSLALSTSFQAYPGTRKDLKDQHCCICINGFGKKSKIVSHENTVYHVFHKSCLENWVQASPTCPLCKKEITKILNLNLKPKEKDTDSLRSLYIQNVVKTIGCIYFMVAIYSFINGLSVDSCEVQEQSNCEMFKSFKQLVLATHSVIVTTVFSDIIYERFIR